MSLEFPQQERAIDPYSSYNSNIVNRLTRLITRGKNCLHGTHAIDVYQDTTNPLDHVIVSKGQAFKDDVIIEITDDHVVDMTHQDYYVNHLNPWNEAGYYYVCLEYTYAKAKPAPVAKIRILKPSQASFYDPDSSAFLLLKIVQVGFNATSGRFEIERLFDVHPDFPDIKRIYAQLYAGVEDTLPAFDQARDEGRIIYCRNEDELFFGTSGAWESFSAIRANIDTTDCEVGQLAYIGQDGKVHPAIATSSTTLADCGVLQIGTGFNGDGKVRLYGILRNVPIEDGRSIQYGENVYLSAVEAGAVTDLVNPVQPQFIGSCITPGDSTDRCDIWFLPTAHGGGGGGLAWEDLYQDLLDGSVFQDLTVETFINDSRIDFSNTTAVISTADFSLVGDPGQYYQSLSMQSEDYTGPRIQCCQVSMAYDSTSNIEIYVSNEGGDPLSWENCELDRIHHVSTYRLKIDNVVGGVDVGDNIRSTITNKVATVVGKIGDYLLVTGDTRADYDYQIGETLENLDQMMSARIIEVVNRQDNNSYFDLRIRIEFVSPGKVEDFGILYNQDEDIFNEHINIVNLISTLFLDMYKLPALVDDGLPRFGKSVEEQFEDVYDYIDSSDATTEIELNMMSSDIDTLYNDMYISPSRDGDGAPNMLVPVEQRLHQIDDDLTDLTNDVNDADNTINNDIDTLYADVYKNPHRDDDGLPNLSLNLEERIERREGSGVNITTASTTISVSDKTTAVFLTSTDTYTITDISDGVLGQEVVFVFLASNTTMQSNSGIRLMGSQNFQGSINDTLTLIYTGSIWVEKCRSLNS